MKKLKIKKVGLVITIVILLSILTPTVLVKSEPEYTLEDPCEGFTALEGSQIFCGIHQGAGYRIEVPENWNGDLLMYAHGYRLFGAEYLWVDNPPFREWLIENGYAWAASSYSANQLDITVGVKDTKALVTIFKKEVAKPDQIYISGDSMGGGIAVTSVEQWPNLYDGALPACGLLAPYEELDVLWDYYVLASALAGVDASYPIPEDFVTSGDYDEVKDALAGAPGWFPFFLNAQGEQLKSAMKFLTGGERPLFEQGFLLWYGPVIEFFIGRPLVQVTIELVATGVQGVGMDNWETNYQFDADPALSPEEQTLNEMIFRIQRDPQAMHPNGLKNMPVTNGNIKVPVLTLHGIGDLFVPFSQEQIYAQRVADQGASDLLVQRAIRDIVHCEFTEEEYQEAFSDLVSWVETGVKPAGDDVLDPDVVSAPDFGCQFTSEDRDYSGVDPIFAIPPCP